MPSTSVRGGAHGLGVVFAHWSMPAVSEVCRTSQVWRWREGEGKRCAYPAMVIISTIHSTSVCVGGGGLGGGGGGGGAGEGGVTE